VTTDDELRQRIVDAAAELFAENGYGGTKLRMVAERADVPPRTVKRLTGGRAQLNIPRTFTSGISIRNASSFGATTIAPVRLLSVLADPK